ncbi:MAG TPA: hypothetical protein VFT87_00045 [Candidatus Saccharimonadales bacterium]|nr:hypothetical protein [Candidatus Saccharimonadales bacterium]
MLNVSLLEYARNRAARELAANPKLGKKGAFKFGVALAVKSIDALGRNPKVAREALPKKLAPADSNGAFDQDVRDQLTQEIDDLLQGDLRTPKGRSATLNALKNNLFLKGPGQAFEPFETFDPLSTEQETPKKQETFPWQEHAKSLGMDPNDMQQFVDEYEQVPHDEREKWVADWLGHRSTLVARISEVEDYRTKFDELLAHRDELPRSERQEADDADPEWLQSAQMLDLDAGTLSDFLDKYEQHPPNERQIFIDFWVDKRLRERYPSGVPEDIPNFKDLLHSTYTQAAETLARQRAEVPGDLDTLEQMMSEPEDEIEELEGTGVLVNLRQNLRRAGRAIWNAPLGMVVKAQTALNSLLNKKNGTQNVPPTEAERLKMRRRAAVFVLGASAIILARHTVEVPSVDELLDMVGFGGEGVDGPVNANAGPDASPSPSPAAPQESLPPSPAPQEQQPPLPPSGELPELPETPKTPETPGVPPQGEVVDQVPPPSTGGERTPTPGGTTELYKPRGDSWWDIAEDLLKDAKKSGDIDSLDGSKRQAVMEALQTANPEGLNQEGIDIKSALDKIATMKTEDASAAQTVESSTTIYEAHRGDTIEKIADRLLEAHGINNPEDSLRDQVEQTLIDNNYTYNGSAHWIDEGENMHLGEAQDVITDFLNPETFEPTGGEAVGNEGGNVPSGAETPEVPTAPGTTEAMGKNTADGGTFAEALADVANRPNADETVPNITPGQDWNAILRNIGIPGVIGAAILLKIGPQLMRRGYAENIATFNNRFIVGRRPVPRRVIHAIQQMALKLTKR